MSYVSGRSPSSPSQKASGSNGARSSICSPVPTKRTGRWSWWPIDNHATSRTAVEFRQDDASHFDGGEELLRLDEAILAGCRVEHKEGLVAQAIVWR